MRLLINNPIGILEKIRKPMGEEIKLNEKEKSKWRGGENHH